MDSHEAIKGGDEEIATSLVEDSDKDENATTLVRITASKRP